MATKAKVVKTFTQQCKEKKFTTDAQIMSYLEGKTIEIISTNGGHNYGPIGTKLKLENILANGAYTSATGSGGVTNNWLVTRLVPGGNSLYFNSFFVIEQTTKESIVEEIDTARKQISELQTLIKESEDKLAFIEEHGLEQFDEDEFKVFQALKALSSKSTEIEKAKIIARLIKG